MLTLVCLFIYFSKVNLLVLSCDTCDALLFNIKLTYYFLFNFVMICQFVSVINCVFHSVHVLLLVYFVLFCGKMNKINKCIFLFFPLTATVSSADIAIHQLTLRQC